MQTQAEKNRNKDFRNLISGTIIYGIGSFGTRLLSFLITPLYTYFINPTDMGSYDLLMTTVSLLVPVIGMQICDALYTMLLQERQEAGRYVMNTYWILAVNFLFAIPAAVFLGWICRIDYWQYAVVLLVESVVYNTLQKLLRGMYRQKQYVMSSLVYTIVFLMLNVIQVCWLKRGIGGMFVSAAAAYAAGIFYMLMAEPAARSLKLADRDKEVQRKMFRFALPLIPNQLNWWVMNSADRYIIKYFLGNEYNGIYAIACKFPTILQLVFSWFNNSWQDVNLSEERKEPGKYYSRVFRSYMIFAFSLLLLIIPASDIFIRIFMSEAYKEAASYVPFLYVGAVFQTFAGFYGVGYLKNGNTKGAAVTSIYGAAVNVVVNIALIRYIGLQAASFSTFIGYLFMWIARVRQTKESMQIRIDRKAFCLWLLSVMIWCGLEICCDMTGMILMLAVGSISFILANRGLIAGLLKKLKKKVFGEKSF